MLHPLVVSDQTQRLNQHAAAGGVLLDLGQDGAGGMPGLDPGAELGFPSRESLATLTASETTDGAQQTQNGGRVKQAVTSVRDSIRRRLS